MSSRVEHALIAVCTLGFAAMKFATRHYQANVRGRATANDAWLEVLMFISSVVVTQPITLPGNNALCNWLIPAQHNAWADLPWWAMTGLLLIDDDLTQYLWHRALHTPLLWPLHRAHHSASYMSVRVTYCNSFFYYLMMPGLWIGGAAVYLGFGPVYATYLIVKLTVIVGAHCTWFWDAPLYRIRTLHPLIWMIERTISTLAAHWAYRALANADGIGHYKGNFDDLLFFWDVLFGTAHITHEYPAQIGLQDGVLFGTEPWTTRMSYPLVQFKRERSALRPGGIATTELEIDQAMSAEQEAA